MKPWIQRKALRWPPLLVVAWAFVAAGGSAFGQLDLNRDGFLDLWQIEYRAFDLEFRGDEDDDEAFNGFESLAGTNPRDAASFLEPLKLTRSSVSDSWELAWDTVAGIGYQIEVSASSKGPWELIGEIIVGDGDRTEQTFDATGIEALQGVSGFARIRIVQIDADGDGVSAYEERLLGTRDDSGTSNADPEGIDDLEFARRRILATRKFGRGGIQFSEAQRNAARFLTQATFGANWELMQRVSSQGIEAWIDEQMNLPPSLHRPLVDRYTARLSERDREWEATRAWAWWTRTMTAPDVLRQRVAFALSEILVVSDRTNEIYDHPHGAAEYYDLLVEGAFGNYEDLLRNVTLSPIMGVYLSHLGNRKTDEEEQIFPDENYAREVMQLFSIGLYELNPDGSRVQVDGKDVPTYDNGDITEMAKVFTGLNFGAQEDYIYADMERRPWLYYRLRETFDVPMEMYDLWHEPGPKTILGGHLIDEATPMEDVTAAVSVLANHDNVGPFIGRLLIQRLVKSNPSPAYVARVSAVWADDGHGERGNLGAVVKAILLDPEASDHGGALADPASGKLREPLLRFVNILRAFDAKPVSGGWRFSGEDAGDEIQQFPLRSPSVFNFYLPDFQPTGPLSDSGLVAPEFQILNSQTVIDFPNLLYEVISWDDLESDLERPIRLNLSDELRLADDPVTLMDRLSLLLGQGTLNESTYQIILAEITHLMQDRAEPQEIVRFAITALSTSPDFNVLR